MMPQIEAEFAQLNRDYEINKKNYEQLVSGVNRRAWGARWTPCCRRRFSPDRSAARVAEAGSTQSRLFLPLTLLLALAAGVAASFAASQIRPVFFDARSLREASGLPLLGTVSLLVDESMKRRERKDLMRFAAACLSLVGAYGAGLLALFLISVRTA
jgi:hypothetical protein